MKLLSKGSELLTFYHGTNRNFTQFEIAKTDEEVSKIIHEHDLGSFACFSRSKEVAEKYSTARKLQTLLPETFFPALEKVLNKIERNSNDFAPVFKEFCVKITEEGYSEAWDYALEGNDPFYKDFYKKYSAFEQMYKLDLNDYLDLLKYVKGSKYNDEPDQLAEVFHALNATVPELPHYVSEFMQEQGFDDSAIPEPQVISVFLTADKILSSKNIEDINYARENDYDIFVYTGDNLVDNEPEYIVLKESCILPLIKDVRVKIDIDEATYYYDYQPRLFNPAKPKFFDSINVEDIENVELNDLIEEFKNKKKNSYKK